MATPTNQQITKGSQIYTPLSLKIYNAFVLGFSNRFVWRCSTNILLKFYNQQITDNHLDVGIGTGYLLDHCKFPSKTPKLALLDLNEYCLKHTARLLKRYQPKTYQGNIYQPLNMIPDKYESIGLNYVLHCLPGDFQQKSAAIQHLKECLNEDGVLFGSTILADQPHNRLGKKLMNIYNKKGIFGNTQDDLAGLKSMLEEHFADVDINIKGVVALFSARKKK